MAVIANKDYLIPSLVSAYWTQTIKRRQKIYEEYNN